MSSRIGNPDTTTPVERHGTIWMKREDDFEFAEVRGGKARACLVLARAAERGLITASARQSPQAAIVAAVARAQDFSTGKIVPLYESLYERVVQG